MKFPQASHNSIQFNSIQFNSIQFNSIQVHSFIGFLRNIICLRPKLYALQTIPNFWDDSGQNNSTNQTKDTIACKGVDKNAQKRSLSFQLYMDVLNSTQPQRHDNITIRSINHQLFILKTNKTSLSLYEDKRWWLNKYTSYPFSHPECLKVWGLEDHYPPPALQESDQNRLEHVLHDHTYE